MSTIPSLTPLTPIGTEEVYVTDGLTNKRVTLNAIAALANTDTGILSVAEDTTPQLGGSLDTNTFDINLGADDGIFPTVAPTSDHNASGNKATLTAGESLVFGDVCYIKSDGKAWKADADGAAPSERGLLIALATISADEAGVFALPGSFIRDDTWAWTVGNPIYLSATAGALTQTAPTPAIVMGIATHADRMFFYPTIQDAASGGGGGGIILIPMVYGANTNDSETYDFLSYLSSTKAGHAFWSLSTGDRISGNAVLPSGLTSIDSAYIWITSGNTTESEIRITVNFASAGEDWEEGGSVNTTLTSSWYTQAATYDLEKLDISSLMTGAVAGDTVQIGVERTGSQTVVVINAFIEYS